jgi:hypothetical protein
MTESVHEIVLDLQPALTAEDGRQYRATVIGTYAADGHWNAWLEFVQPESQHVLRTGIETHQKSETDLHHGAGTLSHVYLLGALGRAVPSQSETAAHRRAVKLSRMTPGPEGTGALDPLTLFALGEHVLRRELQLFTRAALRTLITNHALNPAGLDLSKLTKAQLVTFIVTAIEAQQSRPRTRTRPHPDSPRQMTSRTDSASGAVRPTVQRSLRLRRRISCPESNPLPGVAAVLCARGACSVRPS